MPNVPHLVQRIARGLQVELTEAWTLFRRTTPTVVVADLTPWWKHGNPDVKPYAFQGQSASVAGQNSWAALGLNYDAKVEVLVLDYKIKSTATSIYEYRLELNEFSVVSGGATSARVALLDTRSYTPDNGNAGRSEAGYFYGSSISTTLGGHVFWSDWVEDLSENGGVMSRPTPILLRPGTAFSIIPQQVQNATYVGFKFLEIPKG